MEEKNSGGKRKITPSIPANYISILQLQDRWINEKARKQKEEEEEEEERRRKQQQVEEQRRIEEDLKKPEARGKREEKHLDRSNRKHWGRNSKKKESIDGGEARCAEKEEPAAIGSERSDDAVPRDTRVPEKKRGVRKRYKKKKNQDVAVEDDVVECGSIAPPEFAVTENNTPVKDEIRVYRKKGEKAKGNGLAVTDSTAIETQFENLSIETKNLKAQTRSSNRNRLNQRHDLPPRPIRAASTMVWVKKDQNERAGDGIGSGVKPFNV